MVHFLRFEEINTLVVLLINNNIIEYFLIVRMPILLVVYFFFWFGNPHIGYEIFEFFFHDYIIAFFIYCFN